MTLPTPALLPLFLLACGDPDPQSTSNTSAPDPRAAAFGGYTSIIDETNDENELLSVRTYEYDDNGDIVSVDNDIQDEDGIDWNIVYTMGEPHETARSVLTYDQGGPDGMTTDYTWQDGRLVLEETDAASDGSVDQSGRYLYDADTERVVRWEWDLDGDGAPDDTADFVWESDADGWRVTGDGQDAYGGYTTVEHKDNELHQWLYHYEDDSGAVLDWEMKEYSSIGLPGGFLFTTSQDGEIVSEQDDTVTFDALGRESERLHLVTDGNGDVTLSRTLTARYECP